jgi:GTP cyclohydrolase I
MRKSELIGLSKYARIANWIMSRPQIQEEAVIQLADALEAIMAPDGLALIMEADHFCMQWRGVKDMEASDGQQCDARRVQARTRRCAANSWRSIKR